jgi:hypothetical protein
LNASRLKKSANIRRSLLFIANGVRFDGTKRRIRRPEHFFLIPFAGT